MVLVLSDTANEGAYLPDLEAAGYVLRIREPDWFEHRVFKGPDKDINLHVFPKGCSEIGRMLAFRDWLRENPLDREWYANTKRELARRAWKYVQDYADAKTPVVAEIMKRALDNRTGKESSQRGLFILATFSMRHPSASRWMRG